MTVEHVPTQCLSRVRSTGRPKEVALLWNSARIGHLVECCLALTPGLTVRAGLTMAAEALL
jgi:hypothetical protein